MERMIMAACFSALFVVAAEADSVMRGVGALSCAEFGKAYQDNPKIAEAMYLSWAQGFMAGLNVERDANHKLMRDIPHVDKGLSIMIRQGCDQHPLAFFFDVVKKYYETLPTLKPPQSN